MALTCYDLTVVFHCADELAEAAACCHGQEHVAASTESCPEQVEDDDRTDYSYSDTLDAVGVVGTRLKRALGATGPLTASESLAAPNHSGTLDDTVTAQNRAVKMRDEEAI